MHQLAVPDVRCRVVPSSLPEHPHLTNIGFDARASAVLQQKEPVELPAPIEEWQALGSYLAASQSAAKVAPRGDDPRFPGLAVTQGVEAPVERQEPPHLPASITGLKKKIENRGAPEKPARTGGSGLFFSDVSSPMI